MTTTFLTGLIGSLILVTGAAWPEGKGINYPMRSVKNWLFAIGGFCMLVYAIMGYLSGGPIFFVFLQALVGLSSILMMATVNDKISSVIIVLGGLGLISWSLMLFEGYNTIFFIIGLAGIALGYVFKMGTLRRPLALTLGSILIALFSYIEAIWIFFWLNTFFAIFSGYYMVKMLLKK